MPVTTSAFLNVHDIEKSIEFYRALGFKVANRYKNDVGVTTYADLALQGAELGLGAIGSNDDPEFRSWVATPLGAGVIVYFTVPNADRYFEKAKAAGATVEQPIADRSYGRVFTINDPDGYTLTFIKETRRPVPRKKTTAGRKAAGRKAAGRKAAKKSTPAAKKATASRAGAARRKKSPSRRQR